MLRHPKKHWTPSHWASWKPFGLGEQYPNNYWEVFRAIWINRDQFTYAWDILNKGVCDGCALGTTGMSDWTVEGIHVCNVRLRLLRMNTMPDLASQVLQDASNLAEKNSAELRNLGRLPYPMLRQRGEKGFRRVSWDQAMEVITAKIRASTPNRLSFYLTSRGTVNETYYAAQKAVRAMGTNNIDNAARICHSPSTAGLKTALGVAATTCSYKDWIGTDLLVFIGSNVANNQPVTVKYLHWAKKAGTRIKVIPQYAGIQLLKEAGDQFQYGGSHLCFGWNFPTLDGKAHFSTVSPPQKEVPQGYFLVATRRGKQFNSMVQESKDAITGAVREAVLMSRVDAEQLQLNEGDAVILKNELGEFKGRVYLAPIKPGNLQVHWPEGNVLLDQKKRSPEVGIPDYNALVHLKKLPSQ